MVNGQCGSGISNIRNHSGPEIRIGKKVPIQINEPELQTEELTLFKTYEKATDKGREGQLRIAY